MTIRDLVRELLLCDNIDDEATVELVFRDSENVATACKVMGIPRVKSFRGVIVLEASQVDAIERTII